MMKSLAVRVAGVALASAIGSAVVAVPAMAAPGAVQVAARAIDWRDVSASAAAVHDTRNAKAAQWVLAKHPAKPIPVSKVNLKQAILAASAYADVPEAIVTDASHPLSSASTLTPPWTANGSSSGSSNGSVDGSSNGSLGGPTSISYNDLKVILNTYFATFDWTQVNVPVISATLQGQGVASNIAAPLARLIWQVVKRTFPSYAR